MTTDTIHLQDLQQRGAALRFITCGSVDDGKSTLIGRLLLDSKAVLQDQLESVSKSGQADLALFTDGLSAEREQGITIDVAYRYFATPRRKFIIGDAPGHEQYTRNMVTAASDTDAAIVLVDASRLSWKDKNLKLQPQTQRHSLLLKLLRVPTIVFVVNKLDLVDDTSLAFQNISLAIQSFCKVAGLTTHSIIPISALLGFNVVTQKQDGWAGYTGPSLLNILEDLPTNHTPENDHKQALYLPVQWVEKMTDTKNTQTNTRQSRRILWGRIGAGHIYIGQTVSAFPSQQKATVTQLIDHTRKPLEQATVKQSLGIVLDKELDISRGDYLLANDTQGNKQLHATLAWLDNEPLHTSRIYWVLHGHRWVKAKINTIHHVLDIQTLEKRPSFTSLEANSIAGISLQLLEPLPVVPYLENKRQGAMILVDGSSNQTSGAILVE
jgi:sulfate adenylyltransferase subunit 1